MSDVVSQEFSEKHCSFEEGFRFFSLLSVEGLSSLTEANMLGSFSSQCSYICTPLI